MGKYLTFTYRNHKGEIEQRNVSPIKLEFIRNPGYDYQPGWFLTGIDVDKPDNNPSGNMRSFALSHIILPEHTSFFKLWEA